MKLRPVPTAIAPLPLLERPAPAAVSTPVPGTVGRCKTSHPKSSFDLATAAKALQLDKKAPEATIARAIDAQLEGLDPAQIKALVEGHAARLGVKMDIPVPSIETLKNLAWEMSAGARNNVYMRNVLSAAPAIGTFDTALTRDVMTFAYVLEHATQKLATDPEAFDAVIQAAKNPGGIAGDLLAEGPLYGGKFSIVEAAAEGIVKALRTKRVAPDEFRELLQLNINVMAVMDTPQNNVAGLRLSARTASGATYNPDDKLIRLAFQSDPTEWVSLYNTWNAVLGLQTKVAPYFLTKLLIPSVGDFYDDPKAYMHKRVVALYLFMVWRNNGVETTDTSAPEAAVALATRNAANARMFEARAQIEGHGKGDDHGMFTKLLNHIKHTPDLWKKPKNNVGQLATLLMDELRSRR